MDEKRLVTVLENAIGYMLEHMATKEFIGSYLGLTNDELEKLLPDNIYSQWPQSKKEEK